MSERPDLDAACERLLMQHFHEDEASPFLDPDASDHIRDDVIIVAEHAKSLLPRVQALEAENERLTAKLAKADAIMASDLRGAADVIAQAATDNITTLRARVAELEGELAAVSEWIKVCAEERHLMHSSLGKEDGFWNCSKSVCRNAAAKLRDLARLVPGESDRG